MSEKELIEIIKADPGQAAHMIDMLQDQNKAALKAIEELEDMLVNKKRCTERSERFLENKGVIG